MFFLVQSAFGIPYVFFSQIENDLNHQQCFALF